MLQNDGKPKQVYGGGPKKKKKRAKWKFKAMKYRQKWNVTFHLEMSRSVPDGHVHVVIFSES